jgi:murein L,D-transpeptidase YcbB/YkuD
MAVKHFQERHGLSATGQLDRATVAQLNTPLSQRVRQLQLTLERWRWLPQTLSRPVVIVNIPEFRLYAVEPNHQIAMTMNIVVGRVYRYQTPVFMGEIRDIIFRPSWNVPVPILREEFLPKLADAGGYLAENSYEIVDPQGRIVEGAESSPALKDKLRRGEWFLRQKPGPENSLGLIKFEIPNPYDVYLHGTPSEESFAHSRRDFSHGCIRVEHPAALALWILRGNPEWTEERIAEAMNGEDTVRVAVAAPVATWILYGTAVVDQAGKVHFFRDIYGHDASLQEALDRQHGTAE